MNVHVVTPFRLDKNLGKAYNEVFAQCNEGDWLCVIDWDVMFLTPNFMKFLHGYARSYPDTGIFTCWTNRIHKGAIQQLLPGMYEENDIRKHISMAQSKEIGGYADVTELKKHISGFLMMVSKKTWNEFKFNEDGKCLGVDNEYSDRILAAGKKIFRMNSIYVFHGYRMGMPNDYKDKSHLL